jgi:two-component system chemotaxis response regulator CheY
MKLVIVDDAPFIREVLKHIFTNTEILVVGEAADGFEGVAVVRKTAPDVVLMDIVMPRKSGIEATQEILKSNPNVKIIACSTIDQNEMVLRALDAGCADYIVKPFKAEDVLRVVRRVAQAVGQTSESAYQSVNESRKKSVNASTTENESLKQANNETES